MGFFDDDDDDDLSRPECYGDEHEYEPSSRFCEDCSFKTSCGLKIRNAASKRSATTTTTRRLTSSSRRTNNRFTTSTQITKNKNNTPTTIEEDNEVSFTGALVHNASIEAMQAMVDELSNSIRHIPRKSYKNTWKRKKE